MAKRIKDGICNILVDCSDRFIGFGFGILIWGLTDADRPRMIFVGSGFLMLGYISAALAATKTEIVLPDDGQAGGTRS